METTKTNAQMKEILDSKKLFVFDMDVNRKCEAYYNANYAFIAVLIFSVIHLFLQAEKHDFFQFFVYQ